MANASLASASSQVDTLSSVLPGGEAEANEALVIKEVIEAPTSPVDTDDEPEAKETFVIIIISSSVSCALYSSSVLW